MRRPQFSIRLVLILVALMAVLFAWIGVHHNQRRTQLSFEIEDFRMMRLHAIRQIDRATSGAEKAMWTNSARYCDAAITAREQELGLRSP